MSPYLMEAKNLDPWIQFFKTILDMPVPDDIASITQDTDEIMKRNGSIFWKIKAITAKTTYRMFEDYGDPGELEDKPHVKAFANRFQMEFVNPLLESHLKILFSLKQQFVGSKCLIYVIKFISTSTQLESTMEKLRPFLPNILFDTIIPIMLITEKDISTFKTDPSEYIRNLYDFDETIFQPRNQVQDLLCYLTGKPDCLRNFLESAVKFFDEYAARLGAVDPADWRIKESLMYAIGTIRDNHEKKDELEL